MSDFTIEQLKALKEGAPAMHRYSVDFRGERSHSVKSDSGMIRAHTGYGPDGGAAYKDAELFAAAPTLVDALIAEKRAHQKLRAEMEELVEYLSIQEGYDRPSRFYVHGQQSAMDLIKDILEGDNV